MNSLSTSGLAEAITRSGIPLQELARHGGVDTRELVDRQLFARLPVPVLVRLAQVLDYPVAKLFPGHNDERANHDDASIVGACLGDHAHGLTRDALARALHWDLHRVETALRNLDARIGKAGLRLKGDGSKIRIAGSPRRLTAETRRSLARSYPSDGQLDPAIAQAVWHAAYNHNNPSVDAPGVDDAHRRHLTTSNGQRVHLTEAVRFSLMLTKASY